MTLREDANRIIQDSIQAAMPDSAVRRALERHSFGPGRLLLVAAGKGGWQMATQRAPSGGCASLRRGTRCRMRTPSPPPRRLSNW